MREFVLDLFNRQDTTIIAFLLVTCDTQAGKAQKKGQKKTFQKLSKQRQKAKHWLDSVSPFSSSTTKMGLEKFLRKASRFQRQEIKLNKLKFCCCRLGKSNVCQSDSLFIWWLLHGNNFFLLYFMWEFCFCAVKSNLHCIYIALSSTFTAPENNF